VGVDRSFIQVSSESIGNYVGQYLNKKKHGMGRLIVAEPIEDKNTIVEG